MGIFEYLCLSTRMLSKQMGTIGHGWCYKSLLPGKGDGGLQVPDKPRQI